MATYVWQRNWLLYYYTLTSCTGLKRKETIIDGTPPAKQFCTGIKPSASSKSSLNELAQKNRLDPPMYKTNTLSTGFFTTVIFNGRPFKGAAIFNKKKDAEKSAAQVALQVLTGLSNDENTEKTTNLGISGKLVYQHLWKGGY